MKKVVIFLGIEIFVFFRSKPIIVDIRNIRAKTVILPFSIPNLNIIGYIIDIMIVTIKIIRNISERKLLSSKLLLVKTDMVVIVQTTKAESKTKINAVIYLARIILVRPPGSVIA